MSEALHILNVGFWLVLIVGGGLVALIAVFAVLGGIGDSMHKRNQTQKPAPPPLTEEQMEWKRWVETRGWPTDVTKDK